MIRSAQPSTSSNVKPRDEIINDVTRTMGLGFVPYAQELGLAEQLRVEFEAADGIQSARLANNGQGHEEDPWDFWVFRLSARRELATDSSYRLNFGITFDFGSVFNNVVNPRMSSGGRRGRGRH